MKAVSVALFFLAGSALAMPASQRLERRVAVTDEQSSSPEQDCDQAKRNARQACRSAGNGDCDEIVQKADTECKIDNYRPEGTDQIQHDKCKAMAIQGVEDCVKKNPKIVGQCRRGLSEAYFRCTGTGPGTPSTEQDPKEDGETMPKEDTAPKLEEDECTDEENTGTKAEEDIKTMLKEDTATKQDAVTGPKQDERTSSAFKRWFSLRA
ncbi:hypothetical protein VB005_06314 [Metarhizium brunneum]